MSDTKLRFAIVGAGGYAGVHIDNIRKHGAELGCALSAVAIRPQDRLPGQIEKFAAEGVAVFADAVEMFDALAGKVDAVFIPTSIYTHAALGCAAFQRGHNVYLEKPPAGTVQEVDAMLAAQRSVGRICALGFQAIYSDSITFIKQRVVSGALGRIARLRCWALWPRPDSYYARNEWAASLRHAGQWVLDGPSNNALAHQTANMLHLASPRAGQFARPTAVRAELYHARAIESEDTAAIAVATDSGATACFIASHCTQGPQAGPWIEIDAERATARWQFDGQTEIAYADGRRETACDKTPPAIAALANFTAAVRSGDPSLVGCDLEMGRNFTLAINGAFESAGRPREIPQQYLRRTGAGPDSRVIIDGINEAIIRCGREGKLFSELGLPWATPTSAFDLTGYTCFPKSPAAWAS
jgi:predicted dehydrogenase